MVDVEGAPEINAEQMLVLLYEITSDEDQKTFEDTGDLDFAYEVQGLSRFRVNFFNDHRGPAAVFRQIPSKIMTAEQLQLPQSILDMCQLSKGLVVVTGPSGSGKSTTLAAMVDFVNKTRSDHIITIEDPIEFVHTDQRCLVNQREVGEHTLSFKKALRAALREDPDIILVGEMRDLETIEIAMETAETGHLVFGTLHTTTASSTVDRIIDQFPAERQAQIRSMLAGSLKGVVAQILCKRQPTGRCAAIETLVCTKGISALIREGKTHQIPSAIQTGSKHGMRLLNDSLVELVQAETVEAGEAYRKSTDKDGLMSQFVSAGIRFDPASLNEADAQPASQPASQAPVQAAPSAPFPQAAPAVPIHQDQPEAPTMPPAPGGPGAGDPFEQFRKNRG